MSTLLLFAAGCESTHESVNSSQEASGERFGTKGYELIRDPEKQIGYQVDTILDDNGIICINESPIVTGKNGNNQLLPYIVSYDQNTKTILVNFKPPPGSNADNSRMIIRLKDGLVTIQLNKKN